MVSALAALTLPVAADPHAVVCLLSALEYYGLTTTAPPKVYLAIPRDLRAALPTHVGLQRPVHDRRRTISVPCRVVSCRAVPCRAGPTIRLLPGGRIRWEREVSLMAARRSHVSR